MFLQCLRSTSTGGLPQFRKTLRLSHFSVLGSKGQQQQQQHRTHMNHGGGDGGATARPPPVAGPRLSATTLGLEAAQNTANILRLLEAYSLHGYAAAAAWHERALCWTYRSDQWHVHSPYDDAPPADATTTTGQTTAMPTATTPRLHSLQFSDNRTALVKLTDVYGRIVYLSLLRLDEATSLNDGWTILRQVQAASSTAPQRTDSVDQTQHADPRTALDLALRTYRIIEHGGGTTDFTNATRLFAPQSSLLAVGMADMGQPPSDWSAPAGSLLEIPLSIYLDGVKSQTPHNDAAWAQDCICSVDMTGNAASAVVRVGNGAQTLVFEDHLLLGQAAGGVWKILSKTFSPQAWPATDNGERKD